MGCCRQSAPRAVRAIPQGACHDARRQIGMTQSPVPTRNRPPHLGTRAVCPCLQFNTKTTHPISVCLEHAPEAATPAQTKYLWEIERKTTRLRKAPVLINWSDSEQHHRLSDEPPLATPPDVRSSWLQ